MHPLKQRLIQLETMLDTIGLHPDDLPDYHHSTPNPNMKTFIYSNPVPKDKEPLFPFSFTKALIGVILFLSFVLLITFCTTPAHSQVIMHKAVVHRYPGKYPVASSRHHKVKSHNRVKNKQFAALWRDAKALFTRRGKKRVAI